MSRPSVIQTGGGQIGDDAVHMALGDAEVHRDIAQANLRILSDAEKYPSVICEEAPVGHCGKITRYL